MFYMVAHDTAATVIRKLHKLVRKRNRGFGMFRRREAACCDLVLLDLTSIPPIYVGVENTGVVGVDAHVEYVVYRCLIYYGRMVMQPGVTPCLPLTSFS